LRLSCYHSRSECLPVRGSARISGTPRCQTSLLGWHSNGSSTGQFVKLQLIQLRFWPTSSNAPPRYRALLEWSRKPQTRYSPDWVILRGRKGLTRSNRLAHSGLGRYRSPETQYSSQRGMGSPNPGVISVTTPMPLDIPFYRTLPRPRRRRDIS
jgi:hypothetical protein